MNSFFKTRVNFDSYKKLKERLHVVVPDELDTIYMLLLETTETRKLIIGVASIKGLFTIPDTAKTDRIGKKKKVGRPRKVSQALTL